MRRVLALTLVTILVIALTACAAKPCPFTFADLDPSNTELNGYTFSESDKKTLIAEARQEGVDLSFAEDGSLRMVEADGSVVTFDGQGLWHITDGDGRLIAQVGGDWPETETTALLPKFDHKLMSAYLEGDGVTFTLTFQNVSEKVRRTYAPLLQEAGYTLSPKEKIAEGSYHYEADSEKGWRVILDQANTFVTLSIRPVSALEETASEE